MAATAWAWDIEPPEYDAPVTTASPPAARAKTQHRSIVSAYTDKPLQLCFQNGMVGFVDADTRRFWSAFDSVAGDVVPTDVTDKVNLDLPVHVYAEASPLGASFYAYDAHAWFVAMCASDAEAAIVRAAKGVTCVSSDAPEDARLCDEARAAAAEQVLYVWACEPDRVAHHLIFAHGLRVFPGMVHADVATPVQRAQCTTLHAPRAVTLEDDLARCADAVTSGRVLAHAGSLTGMYDPERVDVSRAALTWGMFAAVHMSERLFQDQCESSAAALFEPLGSYARAILAVQAARARADAPNVSLQFTSEQKPSVAQCQHALVLFYWAAIHADPDTAVMSRADALLNLELYVRYGLLVVRRRAYHFHNGNKKRRKRKTLDD